MRPRLTLALVAASLALLTGAASAPAATAGSTFLTGGLDLPAGAIAGGQSGYSVFEADRSGVSSNGRYVAFTSDADLLDPAANPDTDNVYRKDRFTGAVVLASRATGANGAVPALPCLDPTISDDGRWVAFRTTAALDPLADTDGGQYDVYVRDMTNGTTTLATVGDGVAGSQTTQDASAYDLSGDGDHVAFATVDRLDAGDANALGDIYLRDVAAGRTLLITRRESARTAATGGGSYEPVVSDDGRWVAFVSAATDLVAGFVPDADRDAQVFVRDVSGEVNYLVSNETGAPARAGNGAARDPDIAGSPGALSSVVVAYDSGATNVATAGRDTDPAFSIYVHPLSATSSTIVSRNGGGGADADKRSYWPSISDDGNIVLFTSEATNLGGASTDGFGVYVHDVRDDVTQLASTDNQYAVLPALSADGSYFVWYSGSGVTADSDPDLGGIFGRTYAAPSTLGPAQLVSRPSGSAPFLAAAIDMDRAGAGARTISADGRYVVFRAYSTSRLPGGSHAGPGQIYRRDLLTGATDLVSRATGADGAPAVSFNDLPTISADGTRVAFRSFSHFDPAHPASTTQLYVRDLVAGTTTLVSRAEGAGGAPADASVSAPSISADGQHVAFASAATNLGVGGAMSHAYLRDIPGGHTTLVDRATGASGAIGNDAAGAPVPSADGHFVAFSSQARNLDPDDAADSLSDVYVRDTVAATTTLVSRRGGARGQHATGASDDSAISADGAVVAFTTADETLAPEAGGWGGSRQVVARTLASGANVLVSRAAGAGAPANASADEATVSGNGSVIAFSSRATNLLPGVGGDAREGVFARTMGSGTLAGPPAFGLVDNLLGDYAEHPAISDDGRCLAFRAHGHNAITGTAGDFDTSYLYVVSGVCPKPLPPPVVRPIAIRRARRPTLTRASLTHRRFRVGRRPTAQVAAVAAARRGARRRGHRRPAPVGTTFRFTLSARANVAVVVERQAQGRLVGRFCRTPSRRLRHHLRCVRFVRAGKLTRGGMNAGRDSIAFSGRIGRKALKPGTYRARLRASNAGGTSAWTRVSFVVVRR